MISEVVAYVITLRPNEVLSNRIMKIKTKARELVGNQLYLMDEPHVTLYLGDFETISVWEGGFSSLVEEIKKDVGEFGVHVTDWLVFRDDPLTKRDTLACDIDERDVPKLRKIQKRVVSFLNQYRKQGLPERYRRVYGTLDEIQRANLDAYGHPFVGDVWKPHLSIASFEHDAFETIWKMFRYNCPKGFYDTVSLNVYALDQKSDKMRIAKKFSLK